MESSSSSGGGGGGGYGGGAVGTLLKKSQTSKFNKEAERDKEGESGPDNLRSGTRVIGVYRNVSERKASVLERVAVRNPTTNAETGIFRYYVHWLEFNRKKR